MGTMHTLAGTVFFHDWKSRIHSAVDVNELLSVVREYLDSWTPDQLASLPWLVATPVLHEADAIPTRAALASRAELVFDGSPIEQGLLREMSWTLAAAATRLRRLRSGLRVVH